VMITDTASGPVASSSPAEASTEAVMIVP